MNLWNKLFFPCLLGPSKLVFVLSVDKPINIETIFKFDKVLKHIHLIFQMFHRVDL